MRLATFARSATKCILTVLRQNLGKLEKNDALAASKQEVTRDHLEAEEIVLNMVETFMNLNHLAVDFKSSKQSISKQAGLDPTLSKITKVSAQKLTVIFDVH